MKLPYRPIKPEHLDLDSFESEYGIDFEARDFADATGVPRPVAGMTTPSAKVSVREELVAKALERLADANECRITRIAMDDAYSMKWTRKLPDIDSYVSYSAMADGYEFDEALRGKEGSVFEIARKVKRILDRKEAEQREKHSCVTSSPLADKSSAAKLADILKETEVASAKSAHIIAGMNEALERARRPLEQMTGTLAETFDAIKLVVGKVNELIRASLSEREYVCELGIMVTNGILEAVPLEEGCSIRPVKVVYFERLNQMVLYVQPATTDELMVNIGDLEDALPDLALALDEVVAINSEWASLQAMAGEAKALTKGKPAFVRALVEATHTAVTIATEKAVTIKADERQDFYERKGAYGLI